MGAALALTLADPELDEILRRIANGDASAASDLYVLGKRRAAEWLPLARAIDRGMNRLALDLERERDEGGWSDAPPKRSPRPRTRILRPAGRAFLVSWDRLTKKERVALRRKLGVTRATIAGWRAGAIPTTEHVIALHRLMGIDLATWV
jgi:hypothetical protein